MGDFLFTAASFIVAISILIAFHEFGHFWVAKKLGVKVLRYSIGFGRTLWKKTAGPDQTEYVIAALPLGGYVKMLDEREGEVAGHEQHRAFNRQALWKRSAIVAAGPLFNLLLAIVAYMAVALMGSTGLKPEIGMIVPDSPAARAGLQQGMQIIRVEGWDTPTWDTVFQEALPGIIERSTLDVVARDKAGNERSFELELQGLDLDRDIQRPFKAIGIHLFDMPPIVGEAKAGTPAALAGIKAGDVILQINGTSIRHWEDISDIVSARPNTLLDIKLQRDSEVIDLQVKTYEETYKGKQYGRLGIMRDTSYPKIDDTNRAEHQLGLLDSLPYALHRTWNVSYVTLRVLGLIVTMEMSFTNISGPVNIAVKAGESASLGLDRFIVFLALVSISLGILNLLPIPVLDGGHLMFYVVEFFSGKPVSETVEAIGQRIGIMLLFMLMALALYNDIMRFIH